MTERSSTDTLNDTNAQAARHESLLAQLAMVKQRTLYRMQRGAHPPEKQSFPIDHDTEETLLSDELPSPAPDGRDEYQGFYIHRALNPQAWARTHAEQIAACAPPLCHKQDITIFVHPHTHK